jgi:hypothetical protein
VKCLAARKASLLGLLGLLGFVLIASVSAAQFGRGRQAPRFVPPGSYTGSFLFCRISFRNQPGGDGGGWNVDYPRSDLNLSFRLAELTKTPISHDASGEIRHIIIRLTDPELYRCPFIMMTEPGGAFLDRLEAAALRDYLLKGGFLWADDFWGERAWAVWAGELAKALPSAQHKILELELDHEVFHTLYDVREKLQGPALGFWVGGRGVTSERGYDSAVPHVRAILDDKQRIMVLMTHNTDFGDAFERETDDREYFIEFAARGYAFAVNALIYAMTH